jgi:hypothetical protein
MKTTLKSIFFILLVLVFTHVSFAAEEGQIRFGAQAGNVAPMKDQAAAGNAVGGGAIFNYAVSDEMMFELTYNTSSHTGLKHSDFGAGLNFFVNSYDAAYFYVSAGANFINRELTAVSKTSTGFGVYAGLGVDFDLGKNFSTGIQALYHEAFDTSVDIGTPPVSTKIIQSYTSIMLRLLFVIPNS